MPQEPLVLVHKQTVYGLCVNPHLGFLPVRSFENYAQAHTWIVAELTKQLAGLPTQIERAQDFIRYMIVPDFALSVLGKPDVLAPDLINAYVASHL